LALALAGCVLPSTASAQFDRRRILEAVQVNENAARIAAAQAKQAADVAAASAAARESQAKADQAEQVAQGLRDEFRKTYQGALATLKADTDKNRTLYRRWFTGLTVGGIVFAFLSGVFGLVKWSITGGICGLVTTAVLTGPSAFGVQENLTFYDQLSRQTYALQLETMLIEHPLQADIDRWKNRYLNLTQLITNPPSVKTPEQITKTFVTGT
jgi:hypothetical protein